MTFDTNNLIHYYSEGWFCGNEIEEDINRLSICKKRIFENLSEVKWGELKPVNKDRIFFAKKNGELNVSEVVRIFSKYNLQFNYDFNTLLKEFKKRLKRKNPNLLDWKDSIFKTDEIYKIKRQNDK